MKAILPKIDSWKKWLLIIASIKILLFLFLHYEFQKNGFHKIEGFFVHSGDTFSYYPPIRNFIDGSQLNACRMPGLLPLYGLFYSIFGDFASKNIIVLFQLIAHILSVYVLGLITLKVFRSEFVAQLSMLLYAFSSFVSVFDHMGYTDSFGVSTLIFAIYFFLKYKDSFAIKYLLISGAFFTWSIFFRQIAIVAYASMGILLIAHLIKSQWSFKKIIFASVSFGFVFILFDAAWIKYNYENEEKFIPLVSPIYNCYTGYPEHQFQLLDLPAAWGGDITKWGGEGEWFLNPKMKKEEFPFKSTVFTSYYNLDSLDNLRQAHFRSVNQDLNYEMRKPHIDEVLLKSELYTKSYKSEHAVSFYLLNRIKLLRKFLFPAKLDNLPLPSRADMNLFEFLFKSFYFIFLLAINVLGMIGLLLAIRKKKFVLAISMLSMLGFYIFMGWIEQRYFAPIYPLMVVLSALTLSELLKWRPKII